MAINWSIEIIINFCAAFIMLLGLVIFHLKLRDIKFKSLIAIKLTFLFMFLTWLFEGLADLFLIVFLSQLSFLFYIPLLIFFILFISLSKKETIYSTELIITCVFSPIFVIFAFLPDSIEQISVPIFGYTKFASIGIFDFLVVIYTLILFIFLLYWSILVWNNTPFLYKKEASILLITTLLILPNSLIFLFLIYLHPTFVIFSDIILIIGWSVFIYIFIMEPKLFYILPFIVHRIVVKDHDGFPLFDHDWSESEIGENIFAGFINAVQIMSEKVMHVGRLLDINLQEGILIVYDSKFITVGLATSKSSILLRDCVKNFTIDFEEQFEYLLKTSCKDKKRYEPAYLLIDKYFSNFPYRIIPTERHPLLVSKEYAKIPLQLNDKYNQIFQNEEDLEQIKAELIRSPVSSHDDFLELYKELKDEKEINFDEDAEEQSPE
ncbi:MAG: hypothetical protein ACFFBP_00310 [Promethearchaeota archaeon]